MKYRTNDEASNGYKTKFLNLLRNIAETTLDNEPQTTTYAWFAHAGDNDVVPAHWVRGFEMHVQTHPCPPSIARLINATPRYETIEASAQVHRSSAAYKEMRRVAAAEGLFERPSDLRYLEPLPDGFLHREGVGQSVFQASRAAVRVKGAYMVVEELRPRPEAVSECNEVVREMLTHARERPDEVGSCLALRYLQEYEDETVFVLTVHPSRQEGDRWVASVKVEDLR